MKQYLTRQELLRVVARAASVGWVREESPRIAHHEVARFRNATDNSLALYYTKEDGRFTTFGPGKRLLEEVLK